MQTVYLGGDPSGLEEAGRECAVKVSALGEEAQLSTGLLEWPMLGVGSWGI